PLLPWMLTANAHAQAPVIYTADSTPALLRSFGSLYGDWGGRWRIKSWARDRLHSAVLKRAAAVNAWSEWAARSMRDDYGVPAELAIPTRADCFSMAGLEGLACGLPVVTCPVGGVAELFSDQEQGFFVKVDDGRALAGTLQQLLTSAPLRQQVSARARRLAVQRYDARRNAERLLSLIHEQDAP